MPAEQSADASGPTWNWRLPRALPVTSPASCHGGASRAKYPTEPSQNSWRMAAQPAVAPGFRDIPGNAPGLPVQDGHPLSGLFPRPAATVSGVQPAVGAVADSGFAQICAILHLPRKRDLRLSDQIWGIPTKPGPPPTAHPPSPPSMMSSRITGAQTHRPGPRRFEPPAGPCREYRCRQILREAKSNHRSDTP